MIKKIDANKYGVVRYAISSIEDIADLPREVSVGSEAILVNEDGEKKFRLGSDGWVEVVEVKEYDEDKLRDILEDAKVGYGGIEYETLEERLDKDFDNVYSVLDNRTYIEYEGCRITAKDSLNGLQKETVIKGRTLQNIFDYTKVVSGNALKQSNGIFSSARVTWDYNLKVSDAPLKPNTEYTIFIYYNKNTYTGVPEFRSTSTAILVCPSTLKMKSSGVYRFKTTTPSEINLSNSLIAFKGTDPSTVEGSFNFQLMVLEGDHTQTPLEELPFIEGIESVGDKSKNLFDGKTRNGYYSSGEFKVNSSNLANVNPIEIKPNTYYTGSGDSLPRMSFYDSDMNFISYNPNLTTCLSPSNAKYMNIHAFGATYFQIEEGSRATSYEPYYDGYKVSGKSCGKNLVNKYLYGAVNTGGGISVGYKEKKRIRTDLIKVESNSIYRLNTNMDKFIYFEYSDKNYTFVKQGSWKNFIVNNANSNMVTTSPNTNYIIVEFCKIDENNKDIDVDINDVYIQLEKTNEEIPTPYEPYKESTYSYILDEPLRSLPNGVCDEIDLEKGIVTRRVGVYTLKGTEPLSIATEVTGNVTCIYSSFSGIGINRVDTRNNIMCDKLPVYNYGKYEDIECIMASDACIIMSFKDVSDYDGAVERLKSNPVTFYYELANPTTEYLIKGDKFVTLPNGVKDEISHNSVLRKVGKIVLDGSKIYEVTTGVQGIVRWAHNVLEAKIKGSCICSILDYVTPIQTWQEPFKDGISINSENSTILIYMDKYKEIGQHAKEVKSLLDGLEVYYELETPYTEPINLDEVILDTTRLKSYEPITHITSDNYLLPTIKTQVPSDFNAVVLGLKNNNEALASQVMSLRQTNDELEATNREQDDVIDVTLLALDEVYGMIDEGEIETMSTGSPMVNVYVKMIKRGIKTLDEVPAKYRAEVEELI